MSRVENQDQQSVANSGAVAPHSSLESANVAGREFERLIEKLVDETAGMLMKEYEGKYQSAINGGGSLRIDAMRRAEYAKDCRKLAEGLVIGKLLNVDNPDWNPADPSTYRTAVLDS